MKVKEKAPALIFCNLGLKGHCCFWDAEVTGSVFKAHWYGIQNQNKKIIKNC